MPMPRLAKDRFRFPRTGSLRVWNRPHGVTPDFNSIPTLFSESPCDPSH